MGKIKMKHDYKPAGRYDSNNPESTENATLTRNNRTFITLTFILLVAAAIVLGLSIYEYHHKKASATQKVTAKTVSIPLKIKS